MSTYFELYSPHTYLLNRVLLIIAMESITVRSTKYYILSLFQAEGMFLCLLPVQSEVLSLYSVLRMYSGVRTPGFWNLAEAAETHHLANRSLCQDQRRQLLDPPIVEPRTHRPTPSDNRCLSLPF